jgi:RNA polymerase sigma-70 factor (ECF subfamily)
MNSQNINDSELLVKACKEGCNKSVEKLYRNFAPVIRDHLKKSGLCNQLEDIIHELFIRILVCKLNYKGTGCPRRFMCKTAENISHEHFNANKITISSLHQIGKNRLSSEESISVVLETIELKEVSHIVKNAISELPLKSRQAIELVYINSINAKEAAELVQCEFKVFRNRLNYGLKKLKEKLEKCLLV